MFTGIVQGMARVVLLKDAGDAREMTVELAGFFADVKKGDSIASNGVCLTIEDNNTDTAKFTMIRQTLEMSSFRQVREGSGINLEKPCKADSFLSGHYVMGHVDGVVEVREIVPRETGVEVVFGLSAEYRRYLIDKGSVTLNGISLTVASVSDVDFRVALIPETLDVTDAVDWVPGYQVNLEVDPVAKYVENMLRYRTENFA